MAGYKTYTDTGNIVVTEFTFLAISNLSASENIDWGWYPDMPGNKFFRILPLQGYTFPILGTAYGQTYFNTGGLISIFTDGIITQL